MKPEQASIRNENEQQKNEGNCEMLMKGLGNLEIVKSWKKGTWKFSEKVKWLMKEMSKNKGTLTHHCP